MLSAAPTWPQTARDWLALPRQLDRFLADHFGLRTELVRAHARLRYAVDLPSDLRVIIGRDNWLFLNGDGTIEQATGKLLREAEIAKFADRAAALRAQLAAKGRAPAGRDPAERPDDQSRTPACLGGRGAAVTEYDLMMRALASRGVAAVDLRPPLPRERDHPVYRAQTRTGTSSARSSATTRWSSALGKPDWVIDPARVLRGFVPMQGGDLARLLAISERCDG